MAYNEFLADGLRQSLNERSVSFEEKESFGIQHFIVNNQFCLGVWNDDLKVRIDPDIMNTELKNRKFRTLDPN